MGLDRHEEHERWRRDMQERRSIRAVESAGDLPVPDLGDGPIPLTFHERAALATLRRMVAAGFLGPPPRRP